jgi:predicted LPLAT superfamily acyltransferase
VALLSVRITAADATAYEMPMMASCGIFASCPFTIAKMKAPISVKPRLIQ